MFTWTLAWSLGVMSALVYELQRELEKELAYRERSQKNFDIPLAGDVEIHLLSLGVLHFAKVCDKMSN